jgi:hypothetical protein
MCHDMLTSKLSTNKCTIAGACRNRVQILLPSHLHLYNRQNTLLICVSVSGIRKVHAAASTDGLGLDVAHGRLAHHLRSPIPVPVEQTERDSHDDGRCCRDDERELGRVVVGCVFCLEGLWADDVGDGECCCDDGAPGNLKGISTA